MARRKEVDVKSLQQALLRLEADTSKHTQPHTNTTTNTTATITTTSAAELEHLVLKLDQKEKDYSLLMNRLEQLENENKDLRGMSSSSVVTVLQY